MRHLRILAVSAFVTLVCVGMAHAAEEAHAPANWLDFLFRSITAGLVVFVIWKLAGAKIVAAFAGRRQGIAKELADLEAAREKAREDLMAVEKRIANLEHERKAIVADYTARGEAIKSEMIAKAEHAAAQITAQAKATAQNEIDKALDSLREAIAEEITAAARKELQESLSQKDHEKLLDRVITKVVLQ